MSAPDYPDFPNELTPTGTSYYYAICFAPVTRQPGLGLVTALYRTLRAIPRECTDPAVGLKKLEWWQSQLLTGNTDFPTRHPLINRLHQTAPQIFEQRESMQRLLCEMEHELRAHPLDTDEDLQRHQKATGGVFLRLLTLLSDGSAEQQDLAKTMGHFYAAVEAARNLGLDARRGSILLPASRLQEQVITQHNFFDRTSQAKLESILEHLIASRRESVLQELSSLEAGIGKHHSLGSAFSLVRMADALAAELKRERFRVLIQRTSLTPLRKLWISRMAHVNAKYARTLSLGRLK